MKHHMRLLVQHSCASKGYTGRHKSQPMVWVKQSIMRTWAGLEVRSQDQYCSDCLLQLPLEPAPSAEHCSCTRKAGEMSHIYTQG